MNELSSAAKLEKNKLISDGAYLVLLEIKIYSTDVILRLVRNTEDITWNGYTWAAFNFDLQDRAETSDGEIPEVTIGVSNVNRIVEGYVEQAGGAGKSTVTIRVISSKLLSDEEPMLEEYFTVTKTSCKEDYVTFTLGLGYKKTRRPIFRYMKNFCRAVYGSARCGVSAPIQVQYPKCNHSLIDCRARKNSERFGGEPLVGQGGLYV